LAGLVCGRCGNRTAPNSTYCPTCRWTLYVDTPERTTASVAAPIRLEVPGGVGGFLARRRQEGEREHIRRQFQAIIEPRMEALEGKSKSNPDDFRVQRELGFLTLIQGHYERANAHLHRASELSPDDLETLVNFGIVLAQRGQLQPAINSLTKACEKWPESPVAHFNLALVALQARRPQVVLDSIDALEKLWYKDPTLMEEYRDDAMTARGLAMLLQEKPSEARAALGAAARHDAIIQGSEAEVEEVELPEFERDLSEATDAEVAENTMPGTGVRTVGLDDEDMSEVDMDSIELLQQQEDEAGSADLLNNLAVSEAAMGEVERAVYHLYAAMQLEPGHTKVLNNLGVLAYQQGRLEVAYAYLDAAKQVEEFIEQPDPATYNHLAVVLSAMGKLDEGMDGFHHAGNHERADFEAHYNLGRAYVEFGKPDQGVEHLRFAYQIDPTQADVHVVLGCAYLLRGREKLLEEALKQFKHALHLNPRHRLGLSNLAMTLVEMDNIEGALKVISRTLKLYPKSAETLFELGLVTMEGAGDQKWAHAAGQFGAALETRPDLVPGLFNVSLCHYLMGFRDSAAEQLEIVTARDPALGPAYYLIGVGHAQAKRFNEALLAWKKAIQYEPGNADVYANMGFLSYKRNDWADAIKLYKRAHLLAPGNGEILASLGLCFARNGQLPLALSAFTQSLQLDSRSPITHSNIGLAYYLNKEIEKAIAHWRIVSQLDSTYAEKREEEQQRSYDDSLISLRPLNWRARVIKMSPVLPRPHTKLLPGYNARAFRIVTEDPELQQAIVLRQKYERFGRLLGWMNARIHHHKS